MASLLHDDVLDDAEKRRGIGSLNFVMGNKVLAFSYSLGITYFPLKTYCFFSIFPYFHSCGKQIMRLNFSFYMYGTTCVKIAK